MEAPFKREREMFGDRSPAIRPPAASAANDRRAGDFRHPDEGNHGSAHPDWLHEVNYDGYRLRLERDGDRVRLITRGGYNWTNCYPWIVEAALKNRFQAVRDRWRGDGARSGSQP